LPPHSRCLRLRRCHRAREIIPVQSRCFSGGGPVSRQRIRSGRFRGLEPSEVRVFRAPFGIRTSAFIFRCRCTEQRRLEGDSFELSLVGAFGHSAFGYYTYQISANPAALRTGRLSEICHSTRRPLCPHVVTKGGWCEKKATRWPFSVFYGCCLEVNCQSQRELSVLDGNLSPGSFLHLETYFLFTFSIF
jgi:hypothetical protein